MTSTLQTILHYAIGVVIVAAVVLLVLLGHAITGAQALAVITLVAGVLLGTGATAVGVNLAASSTSAPPQVTTPPASSTPSLLTGDTPAA